MTASRIAFVCSCEDTMTLDGKALAKGCTAQGAELRTAEHLCRSQLDRFLAALGEKRPVTVACTRAAGRAQRLGSVRNRVCVLRWLRCLSLQEIR